MISNQHFAIAIPTVNRTDLLNPTLEKYINDFPTTLILIVDNGNQQILTHENIVIFKQASNLGFTASVNLLLDQAFNASLIPNVFVINDDVYWGKKEDEVHAFLNANMNEDFIVTNFNWCNFMLPKRTYEDVGTFDAANFFNYYSDNDYHYRMKLLNKGYFPSTFLNPIVYLESQSLKKDKSLNDGFDTSKQNYLKKWGGMPAEEKWKTPYNE